MTRKHSTSISQQIREAIDGSGMSRYRICKMIELDQASMSRFMAGECGLGMTTVDALGELLGLRIVAETMPATKKVNKGQ